MDGRPQTTRTAGADCTGRLPRLATMHAQPLTVTAVNCGPLRQAGVDSGREALGLNYWIDPPDGGRPETVTIRFAGTRLDGPDPAGPTDRFQIEATVGPVLPGGGPVAVTRRVEGVSAGRWRVSAQLVAPTRWRPRPNGSEATGRTAFAPVVQARAPGVRLGAWPIMVAAGAVLGLVTTVALFFVAGLPAGPLLTLLAVACAVGLAGARTYFLLTHRHQGYRWILPPGMSIQGFVLAAVATLIAGAAWQGLPVGRVLDLVAPGMLFGMTVGRFGCLLGGCCTGRPTRSRWGVWSSDRTVGTRRIPVQLLESGVAAMLGGAALTADWAWTPRLGGAVFAATIGLYVLARQGLFRLRNDTHTSRGRRVTARVAATVVLVVIGVSLTWCTFPVAGPGISPLALGCVSVTA